MVSADELTALRATVAQSFTDTAVLLRRTAAADGQGGATGAWAEIATISGRLTPRHLRPPRERSEAGGLLAVTHWRWLCAHDADVTPEDRLRIGGLEYEVTETSAPRSEAVELRVELQRVR
ncbi:MAG: head-tail adaptor protein [Armatimonadota bacterium]